jgi:hypothetical protein
MVVLAGVGLFDQKLIPLPEEFNAAVVGFGLALLYEAYSKADLRETMAGLRTTVDTTKRALTEATKTIADTRGRVTTLAHDQAVLEATREESAFRLGRTFTRLVLRGPPEGMFEDPRGSGRRPAGQSKPDGQDPSRPPEWTAKSLAQWDSLRAEGMSPEAMVRYDWRALMRIADTLDARSSVSDVIERLTSGDWPSDGVIPESLTEDHIGSWYRDEFPVVDTVRDLGGFLESKFGNRVSLAFRCGVAFELTSDRLLKGRDAYFAFDTSESNLGLGSSMELWGIDERLVHTTQRVLFPQTRPSDDVVTEYMQRLESILSRFGSISEGRSGPNLDRYLEMIKLDRFANPKSPRFTAALRNMSTDEPRL